MGQEVTRTGTGATVSTISKTPISALVFAPRLLDALLETERGGTEEAVPMLEPEQVPEVKQAISLFEASLEPCPPDHIKRLMTKLGAAFPAGKLTDGEVAAREAVYIELLGDVPLDILATAFKKAGQFCRFFPSAAEIREHARPELSKRKWRLFCLNRMLGKYERDYRPPIGPDQVCKPEEARAIVEEVFAKLGAKPDGPDRAERRERAVRRTRDAA